MSKTIATLFVFRSDSDAARVYQTLQYTDGSLSCECPGWKFKKKTTPDGERTCKHLRYVQAGMGNVHAERVVEYAAVVPTARTPQRAFTQQDLQARRPGRVFDFSND